MNIRLLPEQPQNCKSIYHFVTGQNVPIEIYTHDWDELQWIEMTGEHGTFMVSTLGGLQFFKDGKQLYIENYFTLIDFIRSLGYEAPKSQTRKSWLWPFLLLLCLTSCITIHGYRYRALSTTNAYNTHTNLKELPN